MHVVEVFSFFICLLDFGVCAFSRRVIFLTVEIKHAQEFIVALVELLDQLRVDIFDLLVGGLVSLRLFDDLFEDFLTGFLFFFFVL